MSNIHVPEYEWRKQQRKRRFKNKKRDKKKERFKHDQPTGRKDCFADEDEFEEQEYRR